jgi:hypothetical protein
MSFNFDDLLQQGKGAAENVIQNRNEIKSVLNDLEVSLGKFLQMPIELEEYIEYVQDDQDPIARFTNQFKPKERTGFNVVSIKSSQVKISKDLFKLKRADDVYPVTIVRERSHFVADNQNEFATLIGQVVSNAQFHLQLRSFKRQVDEKLSENTQGIPKSE